MQRIFALIALLLFVGRSEAVQCYSSTSTGASSQRGDPKCDGACCVKVRNVLKKTYTHANESLLSLLTCFYVCSRSIGVFCDLFTFEIHANPCYALFLQLDHYLPGPGGRKVWTTTRFCDVECVFVISLPLKTARAFFQGQ